MIARAAEAAVGQAESPRPRRAAESENVRGVLCALMHELECILHEYLSFHWDRLDEIYDANRHLLRKEGPVCVWRSVASLSVSCLLLLRKASSTIGDPDLIVPAPFTLPCSRLHLSERPSLLTQCYTTALCRTES